MSLNEQEFQNLLQTKFGNSWDRALTVFRNCGENLSGDVANVLLHAVDRGKVNEVLAILEEHYKDHLQYQHPGIRGTVGDAILGVNPTAQVFIDIYKNTLGLQPTIT